MSTQFNSTSFFLSQWSEKPRREINRSLLELDIVDDPSTRKVCSGGTCSLFYETDKKEYLTTGNCQRQTLCTETRILKDGLYLQFGSVSETNNCVSYNQQLRTWKD